jgi:hypothetical protein
MTKNENSSGKPHEQGAAEKRGWSPSVNATHQEDNDSAHRSFHPDDYAGPAGPGRTVAKEETEEVPGDTVESTGRRGEDQGGASRQKGTHDQGPRGPSQRPSGGEDASAITGVDPQDADSDDSRPPRRA